MQLYFQIHRVIFSSYCQSVMISSSVYHLKLYDVFMARHSHFVAIVFVF
jgi:hypothetical protein